MDCQLTVPVPLIVSSGPCRPLVSGRVLRPGLQCVSVPAVPWGSGAPVCGPHAVACPSLCECLCVSTRATRGLAELALKWWHQLAVPPQGGLRCWTRASPPTQVVSGVGGSWRMVGGSACDCLVLLIHTRRADMCVPSASGVTWVTAHFSCSSLGCGAWAHDTGVPGRALQRRLRVGCARSFLIVSLLGSGP